MVFSSYAFLLGFLPLALAGFWALRQFGARDASVTFLLAASLAFYAQWSWPHLALLLGSIAANFTLGRLAATQMTKRARRSACAAGIALNLGLIIAFKYLDFVGGGAAALLGADWRLLNILLPLGISFFTFQQIAYLVDCYETGQYEESRRDYALFVSFFPQLIAGPIVHHSRTRPQFRALREGAFPSDGAPYGVMIFAMGLFKKTMIADPIARMIDPFYAGAAAGEPLGLAASWLAMIGYTLQIYFDFSGYCDMAIGLGLMFGIRLPINFDSPYKSRSVIEFWRRWHMTLSAFLRDYVYKPLGGDGRAQGAGGRARELFRLRNIFLTMLIGGVWHGAAWTFVLWGLMHAAAITANHAARLYCPALDRWRGPSADALKRAALLAFVALSWIMFRADDPAAAFAIMGALVLPAVGEAPTVDAAGLALLVFATGLALGAPNSLEVAGYAENPAKAFPPRDALARAASLLRPTPLSASAAAIMIACGLVAAWRPASFIYFNF